MQYGYCHLSVIPVRAAADESGELINQFLFGEFFKVLEKRKLSSRVRNVFDSSEGWISNSQFLMISNEDFENLKANQPEYSKDLVSFAAISAANLLPVILGSRINKTPFLKYSFEGNSIKSTQKKKNLLQTVLLYLNAPFLKGGRTPFGIDASGLTQMTYKINGYTLKRSVIEQSGQGDALSFIEESEPGDLAFFDNKEGIINHVGIVLEDNYIIHAHGKVRIDRIDHTGIFNAENNQYSHKLRVIKKII